MRRVSYIFLVIGAGVGTIFFASCHKEEKGRIPPPPESATNSIQQELPGESSASPPSSDPMAPPQDVNAVIAQLEKAWESVKSMRASYRSTFIKDGNVAMDNSGTLIYINDENTGKFKYTGVARGSLDGTENREFKGIILFDGVLLYTVGEMPDTTKRVESMVPRLLPTIPPGGRNLFDLLRQDYALTIKSPSIDQNTNHEITIQCWPKEGQTGPFLFSDVQLKFDTTNGRLAEAEGTIPQGGSWKTEITKPEFDGTLDLSEFIFVCPPDATLIESWKSPSQPSMAEMPPHKAEETIAAE